jgi:hypothetical protein
MNRVTDAVSFALVAGIIHHVVFSCFRRHQLASVRIKPLSMCVMNRASCVTDCDTAGTPKEQVSRLFSHTHDAIRSKAQDTYTVQCTENSSAGSIQAATPDSYQESIPTQPCASFGLLHHKRRKTFPMRRAHGASLLSALGRAIYDTGPGHRCMQDNSSAVAASA